MATLQHGERLEVLETRRRFVRVRTVKGVEGWTDANYLLSQQQVSDLDKLAEFAAKLPSQGAGTTYDALNVHTAPSRQAPSFTQIPEKGVVELLLHRVSPRNAVMAAAAAPVKTKSKSPNKIAASKQAKQGKEPPPPPPPAPPPPADWLELSRPRASELPGWVAEESPITAPQGPADDWYLVRTRDGKAGWVLARQISLSIPDEVAQYAEGHVITGYLSLGKVGAADKDNWLWTTKSAGSQGVDFDSFRVFVWSTKRSRYETAYIERNVKGWYPIESAQSGSGEDGAGFSLVLEDKDGQVYKKTYAFSGYRVKVTAKAPFHEPPAVPEVRTSRSFEEAQAAPKASWGDRLGNLRKRWFGR